MAFTKWIQDDFVQSGVFSPIAQFIKNIFKHPNKNPFKKAETIMIMKRAKVKMELKNTDRDDDV